MEKRHSIFSKTLSIILSVIMLLSAMPLTVIGFAEETSYDVGDIIEFGYYPQSRVSDEDVLTVLNSDTAEWTSYGYYYGTNAYGTMVQGDYMKYKDVTLDGVKYRGVKVDKCRPTLIFSSLAASGMMTKNGYVKDNTYWFKYEPIKWKVLDGETGLVLCDSIIDSQAYSNTVYKTTESSVITYWKNSESTVYANNYADSSVREWLNDEFYNTAFSASQKEVIYKTSLNNDAYLEEYSIYNSVATEDNVFFLSYADVSKTEYGFTRVADRLAAGTDYAKCQGVSVASTGNSAWQLRSAGSNSNYVRSVGTNGDLTGVFNVASTSCGVRPAIRINLNAFEYTMFESGDTGTSDCIHSYQSTVTAPTCTEQGFTTHTCTKCGDSYIDTYVEATDHEYVDHEAKAATCTEIGWDAYQTCKNCDYTTYSEISAKGHEYINHTAKAATCTENGWNAYKTCKNCDFTTYKEISAKGHTASGWITQVAATCINEGIEYKECTVCSERLETRVISMTNHVDSDNDGYCDYCGKKINSDDCSHICHSSNFFLKFIWKIINLFNRLFKINQYCECGAKHW